MALGVGVPQLERLVAPLPPHALLLFLSDPGLEAEPFLYQAAGEHLRAGGEVVYAVTNRAPQTVVSGLKALGYDPAAHAPRLHFIDGFSALMGLASDSTYHVKQPSDPASFSETLRVAARERAGALLVVDSLSTLLDQSSPERFAQAWPSIEASMRQFAFTEALFTRWPYTEGVDPVLESFDGVVGVRAVEDRVLVSQYFRVERARWRETVDQKPRLFKALKPGGVHVYVPKIVVTGPYNAGKSSLIHSASDVAVSADHLGTTVALDHGRVVMDGLTADVFGTPGQARFDPVLRIVAGQALGVVVVVDSTKPDSFPRAREMMELTWKQGLPALVAANKQDMPDALPPDEVARLLGAPPHVRIVGCVGQDRESARAVLKALLDQILESEVPA